jgi:hypothetical protein
MKGLPFKGRRCEAHVLRREEMNSRPTDHGEIDRWGVGGALCGSLPSLLWSMKIPPRWTLPFVASRKHTQVLGIRATGDLVYTRPPHWQKRPDSKCRSSSWRKRNKSSREPRKARLSRLTYLLLGFYLS